MLINPYKLQKAADNLQAAQSTVSEFKIDATNKCINSINQLIEKNTIAGINDVKYSFALLQNSVLDAEMTKEDRNVKYHLLNQFGFEILNNIAENYVQAGYNVIKDDKGNIQLKVGQ